MFSLDRGSIHILANWTSKPTLRFDRLVSDSHVGDLGNPDLPNGNVYFPGSKPTVDQIGDAMIFTVHITENSGTGRIVHHAQYRIVVSVDGPAPLNGN